MTATGCRRARFRQDAVALGPDDAAILAVPPRRRRRAARPETPPKFRAIVNAHFKIDPPRPCPRSRRSSTDRWNGCFAYPPRLSVTISSADRLMDVTRANWRTDLAGYAESRALRTNCRRGKSCANGGRPSHHAGTERQTAGAVDATMEQPGAWRGTGPRPGCPPPSRGPCALVTVPPTSSVVWRNDADLTLNIATELKRKPRPSNRASRSRRGHCSQPAARRPLGVRAGGRRHHPGRIRPAAPLSRPSPSTRSSKPRSPSICAASRASMAAGRCSTTASSTSAPA